MCIGLYSKIFFLWSISCDEVYLIEIGIIKEFGRDGVLSSDKINYVASSWVIAYTKNYSYHHLHKELKRDHLLMVYKFQLRKLCNILFVCVKSAYVLTWI